MPCCSLRALDMPASAHGRLLLLTSVPSGALHATTRRRNSPRCSAAAARGSAGDSDEYFRIPRAYAPSSVPLLHTPLVTTAAVEAALLGPDWREFRARLVARERNAFHSSSICATPSPPHITPTPSSPSPIPATHASTACPHPPTAHAPSSQAHASRSHTPPGRAASHHHPGEAATHHVHEDAHAAAATPPQPDMWAHRIAQPELGCLLVANQPNLGFFHRSVVLLLEHDEQEGSMGLVLNRQAALSIADLHVPQEVRAALGEQALHIGGPLNYNTIHLLHGQGCVRDALPVCPGLFTGGLSSALHLVQEGVLQQEDFCVLAGYTGWQPGQLTVEADAWLPVSASPATILALTLGSQDCVHKMWDQLISLVDSSSCSAQ